MDCNELVELITDYLEGRLPPEEHARFEAHLDECDGCATYVEQMRRTIRAMGALEVDSLTPQTRERLLAAFRDFRPG
jgi:anti-sigma factor RsiW